jgi:hypothetical protein
MIGQRGEIAGVIDVRGMVSFLTLNEGGRATDVRLTYRPIHNFGEPDNRENWFGQICLASTEKISPGETREVVIQFNADPALLPLLMPGRT